MPKSNHLLNFHVSKMTNNNGAVTALDAAYDSQSKKLVVKKCDGDVCTTATEKVNLANLFEFPAAKMSLLQRLHTDWLPMKKRKRTVKKSRMSKGKAQAKKKTKKRSL